MIVKGLTLFLAFLCYFANLSWSFALYRGVSGRIQQQQPLRRSFILDFMSAVTDAPLQMINNVSIATGTEIKFRIKEAKLQDLASIVSLRVNVFFPEVSKSLCVNNIFNVLFRTAAKRSIINYLAEDP